MNDDSRASLDHRGKKPAIQPHSGKQVFIHSFLPQFVGDGDETSAGRCRSAHIVHNDVDALETIERLPDDSIRAVGDCDIGLDKIRVIAFQWFRPGRYNDGSSPRAGNAPQSVAAENSI